MKGNALVPLRRGIVSATCLGLLASCLAAQDTLTIQADKPGAAISPTLWGVFFEDINFAGDGGLYAELIKNRSFEFPEAQMGWKQTGDTAHGSIQVLEDKPLNANNPHYLRITVEKDSNGLGLSNEGFRGVGVREDARYRFSVYARVKDGGKPVLRAGFITTDGGELGGTKLTGFTSDWKLYTATIRATATDPKARFKITVEGAGILDLDMVSVFPRATWKNRSNGLRADLVEKLKELQPGFVRFPGGCIVEGRDLSTRYQWKNTIGDVAQRKLIINRWNTEFKHRPTPDYFQSFGLGFYEYFLLCEDIGAQPLPILNCGMACQFNTGELVPLTELDPYLQDALDLIDFANGPASNPWGAKRAAMGHPAPFHLRMIGIGNEQWGPQYFPRYEKFVAAIKAKHPEIKLVTSSGPSPDDERFKFAWDKLRELKAEIVDEHCYANPDWFFKSATRYDKYDRQGPKVFMGEYAAQSVATVSPENRNNWECALAEAAFMTGLERNADVVVMSSYAPLFAHEDAWQWRPDLIWYDNLHSYATPNYYVQQLFSRNRGDVVVPAELKTGEPTTEKARLYASACWESKPGVLIVKVVNSAAIPAAVRLNLRGLKQVAASGTATVLTAAQLTDVNSLSEPNHIAPTVEKLKDIRPEFDYSFKPWSVTVLRLNGTR